MSKKRRKENDVTIAKWIGKGATASAVRNVRRLVYGDDHKLVPQQPPRQPKEKPPAPQSQFIFPHAGEEIEVEPDLEERIALLERRLSMHVNMLDERINRLIAEGIDAFTAPKKS